MTVIASATKIGTLKSKLTNQVVTSATGSIETLIVNHGLARTPHEVIATLRTVITSTSKGTPALILISYTNSIATFVQPDSEVITTAAWDVVCTFAHSIVQ